MLSALKKWFQVEQPIMCPFCRQGVEKNEAICPHCKSEIPELYRNNYDTKSVPISAPIVGLTSHGKTIFLNAIFHMFQELSDSGLWSDLILEPANDKTHELLQNIQFGIAKNQKPLPTELEDQEALIALISGIPLWGSRLMVLRDVKGELFQNFVFHESQRAFCQQAPVAILVQDPTGLEKSPEFSMDSMLKGYIRSLEKAGSDVEKQSCKIILVISKADELGDKLPPHLLEYVESDPIRRAIDGSVGPKDLPNMSNPNYMDSYVNDSLVTLDEHIKQWVRTLRGGNQLLATAKKYGIHMRCTITSAWGQNPDDITKMIPKRVLDPFLWLLEFYSEKK